MDDASKKKASSILRFRFSDLNVRRKLILLHNLFFVILSILVYAAVVPLVESVAPDHAAAAKWALGFVLAVIYILAVLALELLILPRYVYRPIQTMLAADQASQLGDHENEFVQESSIPGDELGRIMRSRNETIRQLRHHEAELLQKNEMLERQDRLASLGLLSASVAHELNTPLAVLQGSIEKLQETVEDPQAQERLSRMLRVTERLLRISESLVDFARVRKEAVGPVTVRTAVDEAWSLVAIDERAAGAHFENRIAEQVAVTGNADRLVQVFVNLLRNAVNAIPTGGHVTVEARSLGSMVSITVEDDGPGIPPEVLPNIFEAFVTARLDARGTGLGLTIAQGIINQHGGMILAGNRPTGGARLEVRLPAAGEWG
jgi:signal transduction histidine kinase